MPNITDIAAAAQAAAHKLGLKKYDISGATEDETSVQVDQGEAQQVQASQHSSVTVRVWNEQQTVGVASTTDVDPIGLELALKTAYEASFFGSADHAPDFSPEALNPITVPASPRIDPAPVSALLETLIKAEKNLLDAHPAIAGVPYNGIGQTDLERFYLNSDGAMRQDARSLASVYLYTKTEEADKQPRSAGAQRISHSLDQLEVDDCLKEAAEKTISHLNYEKITTGKYPVVFSPEAFLSLLGAFSNLFNAQSILDNQSLSKADDLGTTIASPLLSVCDDPLHPSHVSAKAFDGEGTPTRRTEVISQGVLTQFLHSAGTAKRLNAQPTGNARMGAKVTVGRHFLHAFASDAKPAQEFQVETADNVVFVDEVHALHAGVQATQGSFSLPFDGWLLRKGEKVSIESATVAGDFRELLKSIVYVEPTPKFTTSGVSPRVWVGELSITGGD
jgi:PmbA protein